MSRPAWRWAFRVARRDAWRHRGRSALVVALVGFPVLALSVAAVLHRTYQLDPVSKLDRQIGHADARVQWYPYANLQQDVAGGDLSWDADPANPPPVPPTTSQLVALLPAGSRVIEYRQTAQPVHFIGGNSAGDAPLIGLDYSDPLAAGLVHQLGGRAPRSAAEVAVADRTAHDNGIGVGDRIELFAPVRTVTVVGIVEATSATNDPGIYTVPAAVSVTPGAHDQFGGATGGLGWLVDSPGPVTWRDVLDWNRAGFVTASRSVLLNPPPLSQQRLVTTSSSSVDAEDTAAAALVAGMALLEVVLLAGPAFAVAARRKQRELALIGALGGGPADLRRVVLADALGLGLVGGVVGAASGIGVAAVSYDRVTGLAGSLPGPFAVPWLQVLGLAAVAVVTAIAAASLPARRASRTDVVRALAGRLPTEPLRARVPILGIVVAVVGVLVALGAGRENSSLHPEVTVAGIAVLEIGLIIATPALLRLTGRSAGILPLAGRIAVRDASRHRSAAVPAVAAVMAATIGATAALVGVASRNADRTRTYQAQLPRHDTYVSVAGDPNQTAVVVATARRVFAGLPITVANAPVGICTPSLDSDSCLRVVDLEGRITEAGINSVLPSAIVTNGSSVDAVDALLGTHAPAAAAALRAGAVVTATGDAPRTDLMVMGDGVAASERAVAVRVVRVPAALHGAPLLIPPQVAARLHLHTQAAGVLISSDRAPTAAQRRTLAFGLAPLGLDAVTENGPTTSYAALELAIAALAAAIAVVAALVATALANTESRPEMQLLSSLGAAPTTRRGITSARALTIAGLGSVIGTVAGLLPSHAWAQTMTARVVVIPWALVLATMVGIPLIAAALAALTSRTGSRMECAVPAAG